MVLDKWMFLCLKKGHLGGMNDGLENRAIVKMLITRFHSESSNVNFCLITSCRKTGKHFFLSIAASHFKRSFSYVAATGDTFKWVPYYAFILNGCIRQNISFICPLILKGSSAPPSVRWWQTSHIMHCDTLLVVFFKWSQSYSSILSLIFINVSAVPIPLLCKCNFQRSPSLRINYLHNARSFSVSSAFRTR